MTNLNLGHTGAKRQAWHSVSPRDALKLLIEAHPNWERNRILREFRSVVQKNEKMASAVIDYFFTNFYNYLTEREDKDSLTAREQAITEARKTIEQAIAHASHIKMLEILLPNGKRLRECTGIECKAYSSKLGGWLLKLSKLLKPDQTVGAKFTENELRDLYKSVRA